MLTTESTETTETGQRTNLFTDILRLASLVLLCGLSALCGSKFLKIKMLDVSGVDFIVIVLLELHISVKLQRLIKFR